MCFSRVAASAATRGRAPRLSSRARGGFLAGVACGLLALSGCATEPTQLPAWTFPQLPAPRVAPLPLTVGVYYSKAFLRARYEEKSDTIWYMHEPGSASAKLLDSVFASTFRKVVRVPTWPPVNGSRPNVAVVIVPRVSGVSTVSGYITYELDFYTPRGVLKGTWTVLATADAPLFGSQEAFTASALREAAAKLLVGLRERPELSPYLPGPGAAPLTHAAVDGHARDTGIVLLPRAPDDEEWLSCIKSGIHDGAQTMHFIGFEQFRDAAFPWFEPSIQQPLTPAAWARRLSDPLIAAAAVRIGARYALLVGGDTENGPGTGSLACTVAPGGAGCFGFTTGPRHTGLQLTLVDFAQGKLVGDVDVSESGTYTWIGLVVPIPIIDPTETEACRKASAKVRLLLKVR